MPLAVEEPGIVHSGDGSMVIGLVNNMPDSALAATERQFLTLLQAVAGGRDLRIRLSCLPGVPRGPDALDRMEGRYSALEALLASRPDALIVTGTEPRTSTLEEEPYWESLLGLVEWADAHVTTSIWSCLAAHAAAQALEGVRRRRLAEKRFGVFAHQGLVPHALLAGLHAPLLTPHSRWNELPPAALAAAGFRILSASEENGADLFVREDRSLMLCFQGHPEYEPLTILKEYRRDVGRFLRGELLAWPTLPRNYFSEPGLMALADYRRKAEAARDPARIADFPTDALAAGLCAPWRSAAVAVYRNWLGYIAAVRDRPHRRAVT